MISILFLDFVRFAIDFEARPLFAYETANMNFYSLAGISAKVIDFANDFLKTTKKLNNRTETMLFFLEC